MFWFFKSSEKDRVQQIVMPQVPVKNLMPVNDDKYHQKYFAYDDEEPVTAQKD